MTPPSPVPLAPDPAAFIAGPAAVAETHISVIVLLGDRALKIKKPVALPFLDLTTREAREASCHREVELNRRLAPDVYLGVADIVDEGGAPCEHMVVMRRMPAERRLRHLVDRGADVSAGLDALAALVARFHAAADRGPAITAACSRDAVARNWTDNVAALRLAAAPSGGALVDAETVERVGALATEYLVGRAPLFADRAAAGAAVDGHGDLLAEDVFLLDDGPRVLDCLEFDDRLRSVDVLDDVAFLAMDLEHLGAPALAARFLDDYRRHTGEHHPASLAEHFIAYRAGVRAKVACVRAAQGVTAAATDARSFLDLAYRHLQRGRIRLVLVGGLPGTGKSTLARGIGDALGWTVLSTDVVRKELAGLDATAAGGAPFEEGLYRPEMTAATYRELVHRAGRALARGESVVLDASWRSAATRAEAEAVAAATHSAVVPLECVAPAAVAAERIARRGPGPSDATPAIAAAMGERTDFWPQATRIVTAAGPGSAVADALAAIG